MSYLRLAAVAALVIACFGSSGCKVYDPSLLSGGGRDGSVLPPDGCGVRPPRRPTAPDDGEDVGEIAFALKDVLFEQGGDLWRSIGYDLDGFCTEAPDYESECVPPAFEDGVDPPVDGVNGIDNVFGQSLFPLVTVTVPGLQDASRTFQEAGDGSVLLRVFGWNGRDNDARVEVVAAVTVFGTPGMPDGSHVTITASGPEMPDGSFPPPPNWDGDDYFWARDDNFIDGSGERPRIRDDNAYVSNGYLVMTLPERTDFIFPGEDVGVLARLTDAIAVGRIVDGGDALEDLTVAGRWSVNDLLETAQTVGVCAGSAQLDIFQNQIDRISDVRSRAGTGGAGVVCDAVSVGIVFQGYAANWGGIAPGDDLGNACEGM